MHRSLIVLPDDTGRPIIEAIAAARESLRIKMFLFSDPDLLAAVIGARQRGVDVRVMLNPARRSGEVENQGSRQALEDAGVSVEDSNPAFAVTHEKSLVIDGETAFVHSLNWETKNLTETRDYAVVTSHRHEVDEIVTCFDADWTREKFDPGEDSHLIWCNINGRNRVARFIDSANESLFLQNERYQDEVIIERLVRATRRGVRVHVLARPMHFLKAGKLVEGVEGLRILEDLGAKVHKLRGLKLHAKMMLADGQRAIIGSINLAPGSFDDRRELAIEVHDEAVVGRLRQVADRDWENSRPLDLSDEGLIADLEADEPDIAEKLALEERSEAEHGHHRRHGDKEQAGHHGEEHHEESNHKGHHGNHRVG
ncbi:phospholipase D-like domain-containing protein [Accumulibacter sp.]|uniref:phospholipase D-like domain-containing protein n=1 Tax=Accumulibacter sp. TaxID=2053492 RepID=UPI0026002FB6|nr:phospholipase D-like domain-containing protein [Accumulibacter sp.]MCM8596194.1 phospholipase D-like domain-containing protein [Accumulibacter sp.]MCM8626639.1 phospholipase D-like domain-containing protein [Accumulibacter sp.]MDS4050343.1 phospholipase D-like domain-containing protein [Accumulibacter sp.]